jgi:AraC-like DNA-binding protein
MAVLKECNGILPQYEAARIMQLSVTRFRHSFAAWTGHSYREMCVRIKLARGAELLRTTNLSIQRISSLLRYSRRAKFETGFKELFELTPAQYKRTYENKHDSHSGGMFLQAGAGQRQFAGVDSGSVHPKQ